MVSHDATLEAAGGVIKEVSARPRRNRAPVIYNVCTAAPVQRRGLASAALRAVTRRLGKRKRPVLVCSADKVRFYERAGFEVTPLG